MGIIFLYGEFRETLVKDGLWKKKNRLHYGNKISGLFPGTCFKNTIAIMSSYCQVVLGKQHGFKEWFLKMKLTIVPQGIICVFGGKVWRNWMDAYHIAGGKPVSLRGRDQGQAMSWFVKTSMGFPPAPATPICAEDISQPELGEAAFSEVWSSYGDSSYIQI